MDKNEAFERIRRSATNLAGMPDDAHLGPAAVAELVERICRRLSEASVPGLSLIARDLPEES